jgi:hypothetical protein
VSKAFDRVWIRGLILKLKRYGVKGELLCWLKSYLSNICQRVIIKDAISSVGELKAGVPQGSVLGPIKIKSQVVLLIISTENHIISLTWAKFYKPSF